MAHDLTLQAGTNSNFLSSSGCKLHNFSPKTGSPNDVSVTDAIDVLFTMSSPTLVRDRKRQIERFFDIARRRQRLRSGDKAYLQFQLNTDSAIYRTEILDGRIDLIEDSVQESALNVIGAVVYVTRRSFWEGPRTQIPLTNANGTNNTAGLTIYNHDDGGAGHDNFASIAYTDVVGVLPSPLEIEIKMLTSAKTIKNVHICNDTDNASAINFNAMLEGESGSASGGSTPSGSYSNGLRRSFTVNTTNNLSWTIPATTMQYAGGRSVKFLGRLTFNGTVYAKLSLTSGGLTVVSAPEVKLNTEDYFQDLGTIPLPPGGVSWTWADMTLNIAFRSTASVSMTCDFVQMTFADDDVYRYMTFVSGTWLSLDPNDTIVDDGIEGDVYVNSTVTIIGKLPIISARGKPVHVVPNGGAQKLRFLIDGQSTFVDWTFSVRAWYRPRVNLPV